MKGKWTETAEEQLGAPLGAHLLHHEFRDWIPTASIMSRSWKTMQCRVLRCAGFHSDVPLEGIVSEEYITFLLLAWSYLLTYLLAMGSGCPRD